MSNQNENKIYLKGIITRELIHKISSDKNEPKWMLDKRLAALDLFQNAKLPSWGPDLSGLDLQNISYYATPEVSEKSSWSEVPQEIRDTFDKLGIPKAEHEYLGGVGAQYDSGIVYHKIKDSLAKQGVIFENMDVAVLLP